MDAFRYHVRDLSQARRIYVQGLGMEDLGETAAGQLLLRRGALNLLLTADDGRQPRGWARCMISCEALEASVAQLVEAGFSLRTPISEGRAARQVIATDPDGNAVELVQFKSGEQAESGTALVRYLVTDVAAAVSFYRDELGFSVNFDDSPLLAELSAGTVRLVLTGPGTTGWKDLSDGGQQQVAGVNRLVVSTGAPSGVNQDPDGNAVEVAQVSTGA
jgi:catechol 2,3-dioxygenase-like lactoylglutathione lyase family enzyme